MVPIFPNDASCQRLIRAPTLETRERWLEENHYLNMEYAREQRNGYNAKRRQGSGRVLRRSSCRKFLTRPGDLAPGGYYSGLPPRVAPQLSLQLAHHPLLADLYAAPSEEPGRRCSGSTGPGDQIQQRKPILPGRMLASRHSLLVIGTGDLHSFNLVPSRVRDLVSGRIGAQIVSRAVAHSGAGGQ